MEDQDVFSVFEAASDQVIQLLHHGATLSEPQQLQIKHTIEVLRLTYDDWAKISKSGKPSEPIQQPSEPVSAAPPTAH